MWLIVHCFPVSDKCGQTSNVTWLSTTWLLIYRLEVANKKPLFAKPASTWIKISPSYKILYPNPGCYTEKMLFAKASKIIRNWFLTFQTDIFKIICSFQVNLCERKKSFIKIPTLILYLKLWVSTFGSFGSLTWRVLGGWVSNLASFWHKLWEDSICEWPLS